MKALAVILALFLVAGCAGTRVTGFSDPDFAGRSYSHVAVFANTDRLEDAAQLEETTCRAMQKYRIACKRVMDLFPPTRSYTNADIRGVLSGNDVQAVLVFTPREDASRSGVAFYQSFATANAFGGSASGYGTTVPVRSESRASRSRAELIEVESGRTVWIGDANTKGRGRGTSDAKFRAALAKGAVASLMRAGHLSSGAGR